MNNIPKPKLPISPPGGGQSGGPMRQFISRLLTVFLAFLVIISIYSLISGGAEDTEEISLTELARDIKSGSVQEIIVRGNELEIFYSDKLGKISKKEDNVSLAETLISYGVPPDELGLLTIKIENPSGFGFWFVKKWNIECMRHNYSQRKSTAHGTINPVKLVHAFLQH